MLLGNHATEKPTSGTEAFVIQLLLQNRYAEAYELLVSREDKSDSSRYNIALCLYWSGNYRGAIAQLDNIRHAPSLTHRQASLINGDIKSIREKQNQTNDHLSGMSESYLPHFPELFREAVIRLRTDCWLQLQNFPQVIATAAPIRHKGYKNINEALKKAELANDNSI